MKDTEIISAKLDLIFHAILGLPLFVSASVNKEANKKWAEAYKQHKEISQKYKEILEHERDNYIACFEAKVPEEGSNLPSKSNTEDKQTDRIS